MRRLEFIVYCVLACTLLAAAGNPAAAESKGSVAAELVEVNKIWDAAAHNAFTDLIHWRGQFYCAFRESKGHAVKNDVGRVRILASADAKTWRSVALLNSSSPQLGDLVGWDLRDTHFSVTPDGRLMLVGGVYKASVAGTYVSFCSDEDSPDVNLTAPRKVLDPPWWLWTVKWRGDTCWGFAYERLPTKDRTYAVNLMKSTDGINFSVHVPIVINQRGGPCETAIRFDSAGNAYALDRRKAGSALLGKSCGDLTKWKWYELGGEFKNFGGPNLIETPYGWIGGGRMHDGGNNMSLTYIDVENPSMRRILRLPSGGDCSYPGFVWRNNLLYVCYYSTHQGKTSIYLAKVKLLRSTAVPQSPKAKP
jgi:hypothetical protein